MWTYGAVSHAEWKIAGHNLQCVKKLEICSLLQMSFDHPLF